MSTQVTLLHISDLHFGWPLRRSVSEALLRAAKKIQPDAVVVSGDLVHWCEDRQAWRDVQAFLGRFSAPLAVVPGNHDIPRANVLQRLGDPFCHFRQHIHPAIDHVQAIPNAVLVCLSTPRRWCLELGYVSRQQLQWTQRVLSAADPAALRVVVMHHGLHQFGPRIRRTAVRGAKYALERFLEMGVNIVLSGHNHVPHVERLHRRGSLIGAQAGTATALRYRLFGWQPNTVSVIRANAHEIEIEWLLYEHTLNAFAPLEKQVRPRESLLKKKKGSSPPC